MSTGDQNAWVERPAEGVSMGRRWRDVRRLLVRPARVEAIRWGEVVVAGSGGRLVAHRAVRRTVAPDGRMVWITKGDGSWFPDRWAIDAASVEGVVEAVRREDGTVITVRRSDGWWPTVTGWVLSWIWRPVEPAQAKTLSRNVSSDDGS